MQITQLSAQKYKLLEQKYPDANKMIMGIFGTLTPTSTEVAKWKMTWIEYTTYRFPLEVGATYRSGVLTTCNQCGIHPYMWDTNKGAVVFFDEEHFLMFKLTWP